MFSPLTSNLCLTAVPNYSQEVQAPYHFLWQCAFLMFLKLISQRKAWSLQKCWVPYKHWGNVYIICAKKNSTDKTQGVQSSGSKNHWETIYIFWYYIIPRNMLYNSTGAAFIQCNTWSTSTRFILINILTTN